MLGEAPLLFVKVRGPSQLALVKVRGTSQLFLEGVRGGAMDIAAEVRVVLVEKA